MSIPIAPRHVARRFAPLAFRARLRAAAASAATLLAVAMPLPAPTLEPATPHLRTSAASARADSTAPAGRIVGVVRDARGPVALAAVFVDGDGGVNAARVTTVADGRFEFARVDTGVRVVTVRVLGCRPWYAIRRVHAASTESLTCVPECFDPECLANDALSDRCIERPADELARIGRRCRVHRHERLVADTVRVAYGLLVRDPAFERARREFPNADWSWAGGCVITPDSRSWAIVAVCPACREAYARWRDARGVRDEAARHDADAAHGR